MTSIAIADANSFYCSCELALRDDLLGRPVVVVGNNDNCVVSRNLAAKAFIPMGAPVFQYRQIIEQAGIAVFSSNYSLYHEFSQRIHAIMARFVGAENAEEFSIDESFLALTAIPPGERAAAMRELRQLILRETNIPITIGGAATKVLAKLAADLGKKLPDGVRFFEQEDDIDRVLAATAPEDIWYIGAKRAQKLRDLLGISNSLQLKHADLGRVRRLLHVPVARVVAELRGIPALPLQIEVSPRKEMICARSFGHPVITLKELSEAAAAYTATVARRLWSQHSLAATLCVSLHTNRFREDAPQYHASCVMHLPRATNALATLITAAQEGIARIYQGGMKYQKVGIMLTDLASDRLVQGDLFAGDPDAREQRLIATIRAIEAKFGKGAIYIAATGGHAQPWAMRQDHRSPRYLTNWHELPVARA